MKMNPEDKRIKEAFDLYRKNWEETLPSEEELDKKICISSELDQRIFAKIKREKGARRLRLYPWMRAVACLALVAVLGMITYLSIGKEEPSVSKEHNGDGSYSEKEDDPYPERENGFEGITLLPSYLPNGYTLVEEKSEKTKLEHFYEAETKPPLTTCQWLASAQNAPKTEEVQGERVTLRKGVVGIYTHKEKIPCILVEYERYLIEITGDLEKSELIKIAQSMVKWKPGA